MDPISGSPFPPSNPPCSPFSRKPIVLIFFIVFLILISLGSTTYLFYQNRELKKQISSSRITQITPITQTSPSSSPNSPTPSNPSSAVPADWKTYTNEKYGYQIKYPTNYSYTTGQFDPNDSSLLRIYLDKKEPLSNFHLTVITKKETKDISKLAEENYLLNINHKGIPGQSIITPTKTIFQNLEAYQYEIKNKSFVTPREEYLGYEGIYKAFWLEKNGFSYFIYYTKTAETDLILSTFQFLDQTTDISSEAKEAVTNYLKDSGYDLSKITLFEPQNLNTPLADAYTVSWTETGYASGGQYVLVGKKDNQWIIPQSGDHTYCEWIKTAGLDAATQAFMGPTCK